MDAVESALDLARKRQASHVGALESLVAIPSVSTDPERRADTLAAADWLCQRLENAGADEARLLETDGLPIAYARFAAAAGADAPTVLIYGHYDVQPVDPVELWDSDPFEPTQRDGRLYGRGASDMKAQVLACLLAVEACRSIDRLPVNVVFLLEGEEEIGSPSLEAAIERYAELFAADICINPDTGMLSKEQPSIRYGLRGLAYFDLTVKGPTRDLHSGSFGGVVHNPLQAISELVAGMHDEHGRVTLPGFYDRVRIIDDQERERAKQVPVGDRDVLSWTGVSELWGEPEYSVVERVGARPTLEINGMWGGYTGEGSKTVIPAEAHAKISMRLVPDQDPSETRAQLEAYLHEYAPMTISWELHEHANGKPFICDPTSPHHAAFSQALEMVWGRKPVLARIGGSVPVAADLQDHLGIPSVLTGFALPEDRIHSPNESQDLENYLHGIEAMIRYLYLVPGAS